MGYTTPRTWVAGEWPTAAQLNANVRDNVSFLANPPSCRVYHNANQSIADNTATALAFNSERWDTNSMHDTVTANGRITIQTAGLYVVTAHVALTAGADYADVTAYLRQGGTNYLARQSLQCTAASFEPYLSVTTIYKFAVADYIEVVVYHDNTANTARNVLASTFYSPEFAATWIGLG